ncbi:hypothetical protein WA158_001564 [Blastocystis sp. Blastoise]
MSEDIIGERPKDKHPRMIYKNKFGLKKQGAGGKGTWGKPGCELIPVEVDVNDPAYDSEDDTNVILYQVHDEEGKNVKSDITLKEYKAEVEDIIEEYFCSQDLDELRVSLDELKCPTYHYEFIKKSIIRAMDFGPHECELVSQMLNTLVGDEFSPADITKAFEKLLVRIQDVKLDDPDAENDLSKFIARAVADEVIPPSFLVDPICLEKNASVLKMTGDLLNMKHGLARMEKIWGNGSLMTVEEFKEVVKQSLQEYLLSFDLNECLHCIKELNQPFFGHEFVKRSLILGMDGDDKQMKLVEDLIITAFNTEILSYSQLCLGLKRVYSELSDIQLDVPKAPHLLQDFSKHLIEQNIVSEEDFKQIMA